MKEYDSRDTHCLCSHQRSDYDEVRHEYVRRCTPELRSDLVGPVGKPELGARPCSTERNAFGVQPKSRPWVDGAASQGWTSGSRSRRISAPVTCSDRHKDSLTGSRERRTPGPTSTRTRCPHAT